jgi:trk system potassium uptake protein TrkA
VGARLAQLIEAEGHDVAIIDSHPEAFDRLPENFKGQTVLGTGIDVDVLKSAGIEKADAFAAVTNFDNTNIMACEVAKEIFGVKQVLARIYDPGREGMYHQLGLQTVCPTTLVSTAARNILLSTHEQESAQAATAQPSQNGQQQAVTPAPAPISAAAATSPAEATRPVPGTPNSGAFGQQDQTARQGENGRGLRDFFKH